MNKEKLVQHIRKTVTRGDIAASRPAGCPHVNLYLFDESVLEGPLPHEEAQAVVAEPAYWSFCWASGQALASYLRNAPELVQNKVVLDFGCGSGVAGIAAALAGARQVIACDIDSDALDAAIANAQLNEVVLSLCEDIFAAPENIDVILAADVLYDKENLPLLAHLKSLAPLVILADSRVKVLPDADYTQMATIECRTWPDLNEFEEFNEVRIYHAEK